MEPKESKRRRCFFFLFYFYYYCNVSFYLTRKGTCKWLCSAIWVGKEWRYHYKRSSGELILHVYIFLASGGGVSLWPSLIDKSQINTQIIIVHKLILKSISSSSNILTTCRNLLPSLFKFSFLDRCWACPGWVIHKKVKWSRQTKPTASRSSS
jgi:hypothetical protein